jgi:hypothetical protein
MEFILQDGNAFTLARHAVPLNVLLASVDIFLLMESVLLIFLAILLVIIVF